MNAAELYELRTRGIDDDLSFIVELAKACGPSVLELACGTGRVLEALVSAGFAPVGVDRSGEALTLARRRFPSLRLERQLMQCFDLDALFDLVIVAFNSFECLQTMQDKLQMLRRALDHSHSDSLLYVDTRPLDLEADCSATEEAVRPLKTMSGLNGEQIEVLFHRYRDLRTRRRYCTIAYRWQEKDGSFRELLDEYTVSPVTADEFWLMLEVAGFSLVGCYGDHQRTPYDPTRHRQLIALAQPAFGVRPRPPMITFESSTGLFGPPSRGASKIPSHYKRKGGRP